MDDPLYRYPYVLVRIGCDAYQRNGRYRLARRAAKYGAEISRDELLVRLTADLGRIKPAPSVAPPSARLALSI